MGNPDKPPNSHSVLIGGNKKIGPMTCEQVTEWFNETADNQMVRIIKGRRYTETQLMNLFKRAMVERVLSR